MSELKVILKEINFRKSYDLSHLAAKSYSNVRVVKGSAEADVKSILGLLALGLKDEDVVTFRSDNGQILNEIRKFLQYATER